jgi:hypothetical protein
MLRRSKRNGVERCTSLRERKWEVWLVFIQEGSKAIERASMAVDVVHTASDLCTGTDHVTDHSTADNRAYQCSHYASPTDIG